MWYFMKSGCNELADKDNLEAITRRINGGLNGLSNRAYYLRKIKRIFFL
jgi:putative chitinase